MDELRPPVSAKRVVITSFFVDAIDFTINLIVTVFTGSVIMLAETLQGGFDMIASIFLVVGVQRSKKKKDNTHQFGHGRELYFWTLISSLTIFFGTGVLSLFAGIERIVNPIPIEHINYAYIVLVIALFSNTYSFKLSLSRLLGAEKKRNTFKVFINSYRVETKGTFILDSIGAISAFSGLLTLILYRITGEVRFDGIGATIIGLSAIFMSTLLFLGVKDLLIGRSASKDQEKKIKDVINSHKDVKEILDLKTMFMGPNTILIDTEIFLNEMLTAKEIEILIEELKEEMENKVPEARFIQIEVETPENTRKERKREKPDEDY